VIAACSVRLLRCLGWAAFCASIGVVLVSLVSQVACGPETGQAVWPTPRLWRYFGTTLWMATSAATLALLLALPAAFALVSAGRAWQRRLLRSLTIIPLLTMPSLFAYAWMLIATSPNAAVARLVRLVGWNTPGVEPLQAAWVMAAWLWPVPALVLAASFKHAGLHAYQLACLDATPVKAFVRGALPVMRGPLVAALAVVFILAATDATVPPLMGASQVWSVEMLANANVALACSRPAAFLFWASWPMLAAIGVAAAAALPGLRRMTGWADEADVGSSISSRPGWWFLAILLAGAVTLFPIVVFACELAVGRSPPLTTLSTVWNTCGNAILATLLVAALSGAAGALLALAVLDDPNRPLLVRLPGILASALCLATAVLPPELTATALAGFFSSRWLSPPEGWNLYDNTPIAWIAAMLARFVFLPVCVVRLLNRRSLAELTAVARSDGAGPTECLAHVRLPALWRGLAASAMMVACLTLSEAAASVLVQAPRFFGGSLAVHVDSQIHYGRQGETTATSLMLIVPAVLAGAFVPLLGRRRSQ
jgi:ABC-type Fe3+ transport system permease subunit